MMDIHLNDFLYFVDDDLNVSELEIRELIRVYICKEDTYILFKLEDGTEVAAFTDGTIEEYSGSLQLRRFYTSYKEAAKEALKNIDEEIELYADLSKTLRELMYKKKRLEEEV